eukprot:TRINITY_DN31655_c0_g1_i2.p1 TRINITY_DN31655_c0_g1~~TRINITY_DN31655_c0_g1_i2.p1  ORF type:complete len:616 (+),score=175.00 TRINITY_DN31655_c0_g1_i2:149-1996(+)
MEERFAQLEGKVRRLQEEVEACSVLVLQFDANVAAGGGDPLGGQAVGGAQRLGAAADAAALEATRASMAAEVDRLAARIEVLEQAHVIRGESASQASEESFVRFEMELKEVWRAMREQQRGAGSAVSAAAVAELGDQVQSGLRSLRAELAEVRRSMGDTPETAQPQNLEAVLEKMAAELGKSAMALEERTGRLEQSLARVEAVEVSAKADRHRAAELERMVELLVQQRREDILATNAQIREIDARFKRIKESGNWADEADALRAELEAIHLEKIPSIFQHSTRTARVIAEGLQALRAEVQDLQDGRVAGNKPGEYSKGLEFAAEAAAMRTEMQVLREELNGHLDGGFDGLLMNLRADLSAELEATARGMRESWADVNRRVAALEPWKDEHVGLHAEVRALRLERQEDRARFALTVQEELTRLRDSIESRLNSLKKEVLVESALQSAGAGAAKALGAPSPRGRPTSPGQLPALTAGPGDQATIPRVVVLGRRARWTLSAAALASAKHYGGGLLVTTEFEVSGVLCRLKFFPEGSPLRKEEGFCSLYLLCLMPVEIKFVLFAGSYETPPMTCLYDRKRDQGRNDLCSLDKVLDGEGGVEVGLEVLDVHPLAEDTSRP